MRGQESDGDTERCRGREGEEVRSASGWNDLSERELSGDETQCRMNCKRLIRNIKPTYKLIYLHKRKTVSVHVKIALVFRQLYPDCMILTSRS